MKVLTPPNSVPIKLWVEGVEVEDTARQQLFNVASLPFIYKHIAVMPDVHWGMGATVGSVIPTKGAIVPAAVGVDIGCGMMAMQLDLKASQLPSALFALRAAIERCVPHGRTNNGREGDRGAWGNVPPNVAAAWLDNNPNLRVGWEQLVADYPKLEKGNLVNHLGTLGTGNHFIEVCLDEADSVWLMLHSGSRGVGNRIGSYFIDLAGKEMERWFVKLPDPALGYLPEHSQHFAGYMRGVMWAQEFARVNRELMMTGTYSALATFLGRRPDVVTAINCHHNYVAKENHFGQNVWVTRKGAIRARQGDLGIIPGSMGTGSYIVRGKGNPESFHSCSHGAGRRMSRGEARRTFSLDDHAAATVGVECRKDADVIDETPGAYKDINHVMKAQEDLVEIVHPLKQIICVKG